MLGYQYAANAGSGSPAASTGGSNFSLGGLLDKTLSTGLEVLGTWGAYEIQNDILKDRAETQAFINGLQNEAAGQNTVSPQVQGANAAATGQTGFVWKPWMTAAAIGAGVLVGGVLIVKAL